MSCRDTSGGALATSLARAYSGLTDREVRSIFHSLKREAAGLPHPTEAEFDFWRRRQSQLISNAPISESQRRRLRDKHFQTLGEYPSGALFHAWMNVEARCRQEAVIRSISAAVDIEPPGSQKEHYSLGSDGRPTHVWYASYGSNMNRARFLTYLQGGTPPGSTRPHIGSRDRTPPQGDIPIRFDGRMHFAYRSSRWQGGGVGFIDLASPGHSLGRAYLITSEQFDDIVAQENGLPPTKGSAVDIQKTLEKGVSVHSPLSVYGTLAHVGDYDNAPVLTFTGNFSEVDSLYEAALAADGDLTADTFIARNEPHGNYLRMVAAGLSEAFGMTRHQQVDYLRGCGGAERWPRRGLLNVLRAKRPIPVKRSEGVRIVAPSTERDRPMYAESPADRYIPSFRPTPEWRAPSEEAPPSLSWSFGKPEASPSSKRALPASAPVTKRCSICNEWHSLHDCPFLKRKATT